MTNFQSFNFRDRFIRHSSFLGELHPFSNAQSEDFAFIEINRGNGRVSLRSANFPDRLLRHRDFRIRLEAPAGPGDEIFRMDSMFVVVKGLADPRGISFRSVNFPDRFLRHRDFHLYLEPRDSPNLAPDATFLRSVRLAEPVGIPADD